MTLISTFSPQIRRSTLNECRECEQKTTTTTTTTKIPSKIFENFKFSYIYIYAHTHTHYLYTNPSTDKTFFIANISTLYRHKTAQILDVIVLFSYIYSFSIRTYTCIHSIRTHTHYHTIMAYMAWLAGKLF